jgi:outer membrane protein OmpA-like peptidoglycan-associated protein
MTTRAQQIEALEHQAFSIERNPANIIGGLKAWNSGDKTTLKPAAQRKLDKINEQLDALLDQCEA